MPHGPQIPYLLEVVVFLVAAVVLVPLFQRVRASPVLGYLAAGVIVGPFGLGIINDVEGVKTMAELGVVFLLFVIGLELSFDRLWELRRLVFGLGGLQVVVTGVVIGVIAWLWGNSADSAVLIGAALALSSTAVVLQLLIERREIALRFGRASFAVLLFQDIAVVPILFLVNVLGQDSGGSIVVSLGLAFGKAIAAVAVIILLGRLLIRPVFRLVASTRSVELFMAVTLLAILGTAYATGFAGLSMALGAFLAGLLLAETEFRHQIEADIQPFKGLLVGLFFISVGMGVDLEAAGEQAFWVIPSVFGLILIKAAIIAGLFLAFGLRRDEAVRGGLLLGQAGEFGFLIVGSAMVFGVVPESVGQFMLLVTGLSLAVTPFLAPLGQKAGALIAHRDERVQHGSADEDLEDLESHVVIAGFGRVGQTVARFLDRLEIPFVAMDLDVERIAQCRREGIPVHYGDGTRTDMLKKIGMDRAMAAVITLDNHQAAGRAVSSIRQAWPDLPVFVRARDAGHSSEISALGATLVVPETVESSLQLAGQVVHALGTPTETIEGLIEEIRETEYSGLTEVIGEKSGKA